MLKKLCVPQVIKVIKTVSLSNNPITDRIPKKWLEIAKKLLHVTLRKVPFTIQLDKTTTIADKSVLFVYVQYINLKQDILMSTNLNTTKY